MRKKSVSVFLIVCTALCLLGGCGQNSQETAQENELLQKIVTKVSAEAEQAEALMEQIASNGVNEKTIRSMEESGDIDVSELDEFVFSYDEDRKLRTGSIFTDSNGSGSSSSAAVILAKMQLEMAQQTKNGAAQYMNSINEAQTRQKQASQFLETAKSQKQALEAARTRGNSQDVQTAMTMPGQMQAFLQQNGMAGCMQAASGGMFDERGWETVIYTLESYIEMTASDIQSQMGHMQDFMGQYNSYTGSSCSTLQQGMQQLQSTTRGQSLFSANGVTVTVVPAATAAIAGILLGMLAMWLIMRSRAKGTGGERQ